MFCKSVFALVAIAIVTALPSVASAAEQRVRIITKSEPLKISKDDELIGLNRTANLRAMPAYLPADERPGHSIIIDDLSRNISGGWVTVIAPKGMRIWRASKWVFHVTGRSTFTYFGNGIWSAVWQ